MRPHSKKLYRVYAADHVVSAMHARDEEVVNSFTSGYTVHFVLNEEIYHGYKRCEKTAFALHQSKARQSGLRTYATDVHHLGER